VLRHNPPHHRRTLHLENQPNNLPSLKEGDQVTVSLPALNDWVYASGDEPVGGFTQRAIQEIQGLADEDEE